MRNRYMQAYRTMRRAGANPRRADPRYARPIVLTVPQAVTIAAGFVAIGLALATTGYAVVGFHTTNPADVRIVGIVRSAVPAVDALSQDDLVARLSVPPQLGLLLAPLAANDPAREPIRSTGWLDDVQGGPAPVTLPDRMRALGEIASALASLPEAERSDQINSLVALYKATREPSSRAIITDVGGLPSGQRDRLAGTKVLQPILIAVATLPDTAVRALASDPDRLRLALSITQIHELSDAQLTDVAAGLSDKALGQVVLYVIDQVRSGNHEIMRLLNGYWGQTQVPMPFVPAPANQVQPGPSVPNPAKRLSRDR